MLLASFASPAIAIGIAFLLLAAGLLVLAAMDWSKDKIEQTMDLDDFLAQLKEEDREAQQQEDDKP
jgi:hypothetical protein